MKIVYSGPLAGGTVGESPSFVFVRGEPLEVPDAFGEKLVSECPDWAQSEKE